MKTSEREMRFIKWCADRDPRLHLDGSDMTVVELFRLAEHSMLVAGKEFAPPRCPDCGEICTRSGTRGTRDGGNCEKEGLWDSVGRERNRMAPPGVRPAERECSGRSRERRSVEVDVVRPGSGFGPGGQTPLGCDGREYPP
jgi:hypothetical protein